MFVRLIDIFVHKDLFLNRRNPNQCPIKSTFYVSHEWTDYSQVQDLYAGLFTFNIILFVYNLFCLLYLFVYFYAAGHEIASHTVTHSDGKGFDDVKWADELIGLAEMLVSIVLIYFVYFLSHLFVYICFVNKYFCLQVRYAGVDPQDIKGMRAPFLQVGGSN